MTETQPSILEKEIIKTIAVPSHCNKYPVFNHYAGKEIPLCENKFQRINLIYGWNYSGKTSLSRIFKEVQKATVFNRDFVKDNLTFFGQEKNKHFWILGEEGAKLKKKEQRFIQFQEKKSQEQIQINKNIDDWKIGLAGKVKGELSLKPNQFTKIQVTNILLNPYNNINEWLGQNSIEQLINNPDKFPSQSDFDGAKLIFNTKETPIKIDTELNFYTLVTNIITETKVLAIKTAKKDDPLDRLSIGEIKDWVRDGLKIHKDHSVKDKCFFCDSSIKWQNLEKQLEEQFNEDYENLVKEIDTFRDDLSHKIDEMEKQRNTLSESESQKLVRDESKTKWNSIIKKIGFDELFTNLNSLKKQIVKKTPDTTFELSETILPQDFEINEIALTSLIQSHNKLVEDFESEKTKAKQTIVKYLFANDLPEYKDLQKKEKNIEECLEKVKNRIEEIQRKIEEQNQSAVRINQLLSKMVLNKQFEIKEEENGFKIYNQSCEMDHRKLSEGEQTIIAFAYFLAKLEEDYSNEQKDSNQNHLKIIFIDDPMSSLDSSHLHMLAAQIRELAEKTNYQIFLTTHHYEFFCILRDKLQVIQKNERKKIEKENKNIDKNNQKEKLQETDLISFYMLEKYSENQTNLRKMPKYLEKDRTEYLYCLEQIQNFINGSRSNEDEENEFVLYSLPNAIRKCLEIFIKFKDPKQESLSLLDNYLKTKDKLHLKEFLNNIYNDGSHAWIIGGRNSSNIKEPSQIKEAAQVVYDLLELDREHFKNACNLIKECN